MAHITNIVNRFRLNSVIDTCAIGHLLSSLTLYRLAVGIGCDFVMPGFVEYEALYKPRTMNREQEEMLTRLREERKRGRFTTYNTSIEDLQEIGRLEESRRLGKGELSAIALAKKINIAVTTDDKKAFRLALQEMTSAEQVQTIPQLVGWLVYTDKLSDGDVTVIIAEHQAMGESHHHHFNELYLEGMRLRLSENVAKKIEEGIPA